MGDTGAPIAVTAQPLALRFADDGLIPNNPTLPLVVYRKAIDVAGQRNPAAVIEAVFDRNGWGDMWRNGIYPFPHYHAMIHEVLGVARGTARVRFGGSRGQELEIGPGDVAILSAGTGHQRISAGDDLLIVGAYPPEGTYDLCRANKDDCARARLTIPTVPLPHSDPVYGENGPLLALWGR
jgi:uncharacterized protein YjlB